MAAILKRFFRLLNSDLTGRSWEKEVPHAYFQQLVYFGHKDPSRCYWEAELPVPGAVGRTTVWMEGTVGPGPAEEAFCKATLSDLDQLFRKCRHLFEPEFASWARQPVPSDWSKAFKLDGFSIPPGGETTGVWQVTYYVEPVGRYFTAHFESGKVQRVEVDG